jgi:hypothetical protein
MMHFSLEVTRQLIRILDGLAQCDNNGKAQNNLIDVVFCFFSYLTDYVFYFSHRSAYPSNALHT